MRESPSLCPFFLDCEVTPWPALGPWGGGLGTGLIPCRSPEQETAQAKPDVPLLEGRRAVSRDPHTMAGQQSSAAGRALLCVPKMVTLSVAVREGFGRASSSIWKKSRFLLRFSE